VFFQEEFYKIVVGYLYIKILSLWCLAFINVQVLSVL
jgi:hypothetical protein